MSLSLFLTFVLFRFFSLRPLRPSVIIMDEPTNHLDLETVEALIHALNGFQGGVLLVSHDKHFIEHVAKEFWAVVRHTHRGTH